jgi:glycosyltransferase involved in cell wall biosynthesis
MRFGVDATGLGEPKTGTAVYLSEILAAWARDSDVNHEFVVFATPQARLHLSDLKKDKRFTWVNAPANRHWRVIWQQIVLPWHLKRQHVDVHWGAGFVLPLLGMCKKVLTVHDLTFQMYPEMHEPAKRIYFPAMIRASVAKAQSVMTVSRSTEIDLHAIVPASIGKTRVTLLAARILSQPAGAENLSPLCQHPYLLFVGTMEPRKNLARLLEAWQGLSVAIKGEARLVILGAPGWLMNASMSKLEADESVVLAGHVTDDELARWMSNALAFLYPSMYEGFGLPVLEAMAHGIPVLTSNVGATKEIAGQAAVLVDPSSTQSIQDGLTQLLSSAQFRSDLRTAGQKRAAEFSWERTAQETLSVLCQVGNMSTCLKAK